MSVRMLMKNKKLILMWLKWFQSQERDLVKGYVRTCFDFQTVLLLEKVSGHVNFL